MVTLASLRALCSSSLTRRRWIANLLLALAIVTAACDGGKQAVKEPAGSPTVDDSPQVFDISALPAQPDAGTPEGSPSRHPTPSEVAAIARLVVPAAKIDAPVQIKGVNARNEMETPDGKDNIAWYNFTARPGFGSNAVFSGHVDWFTGERGVFWYLRDLKEGDEISIRLSDGMELKYRVASSVVYKVQTAPVAEIVGPTTTEAITLITCEGTFNRGSQEYSDRRVVRAERVA